MQPKHHVGFFLSFSPLCYSFIPLTLISPMTTTLGNNSITMMAFHRICKEEDWKSQPLFPSWRKKNKVQHKHIHSLSLSLTNVTTELKSLKTHSHALFLTMSQIELKTLKRERERKGSLWVCLVIRRQTQLVYLVPSFQFLFVYFNLCLFLKRKIIIN